MRLRAVELRRVRVPLVRPFRTSFGTERERDILLVRVETGDVQGWGECVAMTEPLYSSEYVEGAAHVVRHHLVPRLLEAGPLSAAGVGRALAPVRGHAMAKACLEMAVLDAELQESGTSLASRLGGVRDAVDAGVSVGIPDSIPELLDTVGEYLDAGYRRIKLKIEPGWDLEPVRAVRERFGDIALQVDANAAYELADAAHLIHLDEFGLVLIEQPFAEDDLAGHAELARHLRTPLCLDESITSARVAGIALDLGACTIVNIKAGRVGGYLEAVRVHDACVARGAPVWCGGMLELGLGRAANVALASLPGFTLPGDLSASERYWARDITPPFVLVDGRLAVPPGPGLGVAPIPEVLDELTTSVEVVAAGV